MHQPFATMKKIITLSAALFTAAFSFAQKAYFQQDVAYTIRVSLNDTKHEISGFETLVYKNNSQDALPFIYMHLWPNAYKNNQTALGKQLKESGELFFYYADEKDRGYIDSLDFKVDGQSAKLEYDPENIDIAKLILPSPLAPGGQITITTPFHVKIPSGKISRLGHIDQQYQITQWYPKPAVYDRNGWNQIPYLNQGEFYSEFGTYDVFITLPKNYVLGATGDLVDNPEEEKFLNEIAGKTKEINSYDPKDLKYPESSSEWKTVHYHQERVHDFAWFCDKRYHVLKGEVKLPHTGRKVTTWVMYTNKYAEYWKKGVDYVNDALFYYSKWNGDYLYNNCTAVDGALSAGGGMEYPNITVIGAVQSAQMLDLVITHEVGHNWFYGMLGSNERIHTWMDEGINSANEERYMATKYPAAKLAGGIPMSGMLDLDRYKQKSQYYQFYCFSARQHLDQPDDIPAGDYTELNYGAIVYMKSAVIFNYLRDYLGDSLYDKCFQVYFDRWSLKHPMPEDMKAVFTEVSGKNLDWLFEDLIKTNKHLDYRICDFTQAKGEIKAPSVFPQSATGDPNVLGKYLITVKNTGEINGPFSISGMLYGKVIKTQWYEGFSGKQAVEFPAGDYDEFRIDQAEWMPEVNRKNNIMYTHGVFKKAEPFKLQFAGSLDSPTRTQLFWTPAIGFNKYDKLMLGAAFYNHVVPGKRVEWLLMPMYSFGDKSPVGHADLFFNFWPNAGAQKISIGANASRFHYYTIGAGDYPLSGVIPDRRFGFTKVAPEINIDFRKSRARSPIDQSVKLRAVWLRTNVIEQGYDYNTGQFKWAVGYQDNSIYEFSYIFRNNRSVHPFDFTVKLQGMEDVVKAQITGNYEISLNAKKGIDIRFFAGTFIVNANQGAGPYRFRMSGWGPLGIGNHDYLFDHTFIGRSENDGLWAQQTTVEDGGFKIYSAAGQSDKWLGAMNIAIPMPGKNKLLNMFRIYGDIGMYNTTGLTKSEFMYDAGIQFAPTGANGPFSVYFPLVYSSQIKDYYTANSLKYGNMIRFTLNLEELNPLNKLKNFQL